MKVKVTDIHENRAYPGNTYAYLRDAETNEILISATLEYVFEALRDETRGFECVNTKSDRWGNLKIIL